MKENAIRTEVGGLRLSAILFDEAFLMEGFRKPAALHRHSDYEIFFVLQGSLSVTGGDGTCVCATPGTALILPPLYDHRTDATDLQGYCMYFQWEGKQSHREGPQQKAVQALKDRISTVPLSREGIFYMEQLAKAVRSPAPEGTESHLTALLFAELFRPLLPLTSTDESRKSLRYANTIDLYVSEHYREKLRLEDLARALYLCPKQVTRIIRKTYGCSLPDLVRRHRIGLAKQLLLETDGSVAEIAATVGFDSPNYFYACFREDCKETPSAFRQRHQAENARS